MNDEVIRVSQIMLRLSDDRTQASLKCTSPERENDFVLMMKMEVLEQLKMAAIRATKGRSSEPVDEPNE